jgi:NADH-quinone oxidoreductase subunit J
MGNPILFIILAAVAIVAALLMVLSRNAVHSAMFLVLNFVTIAVLYIVLNAPFIAMVQVTVYAGAIMVLFLFVIMLLGAERLRAVGGGPGWQLSLALLLALILIVAFVYLLAQGDVPIASSTQGTLDSSPTNLGLRLFEAYVFPFEVTGILLLVAMIGVVVLGGVRKRGKNA